MGKRLTRNALLIAIIALAILDGYLTYIYMLGSPLPYTGTLSIGPYQLVAVRNNEAILYNEYSPSSPRTSITEIMIIKGVNTINGKTLWITNVTSSSLAPPLLTAFSLINNDLFLITYGQYIYHIGKWPIPETTINVTVINTLTGNIINSTAIIATPYIVVLNVVNNHLYVLIFPPSTNNMTVIYYKLSNSPPYVTPVWNQTLTNICGPYNTTGFIGIHEGIKYVLMTIPCNKTIHIYLLNKANGEVLRSLFINSPLGVARVYGVINNTVIYLCGPRICGTNIVTNETWSIPITGYLTSVTTYGDKAIILMMSDNTLIMDTVAPNGTVLMRRALWSYKPPWCAPGYAVEIYSFSAGAIHLLGNYFLILASPFALTYTASGYVCLPEAMIIVNVTNGRVITRVTRSTWSGMSGDLGPSLYMDYTSNNTIIYTQCTLGHCTTYKTTPQTLIKDQWYYTTTDTPYPIITTTTLLAILAILYKTKRKRQF